MSPLNDVVQDYTAQAIQELLEEEMEVSDLMRANKDYQHDLNDSHIIDLDWPDVLLLVDEAIKQVGRRCLLEEKQLPILLRELAVLGLELRITQNIDLCLTYMMAHLGERLYIRPKNVQDEDEKPFWIEDDIGGVPIFLADKYDVDMYREEKDG